MKKALLTIYLMAMYSLGVDFSIPVKCPIEVSQPAQLEKVTWSQGSTPLMAFDLSRRGRPLDVDTNLVVRMIIAPN